MAIIRADQLQQGDVSNNEVEHVVEQLSDYFNDSLERVRAVRD